MKKVGPVDEKNRVIIAEAGATWKDVDVEAQRFGLQLRYFSFEHRLNCRRRNSWGTLLV